MTPFSDFSLSSFNPATQRSIMVWLLSFFYLLLIFLTATATGQESVELLPLHYSAVVLQASPENGLPVAVQLQTEYLNNVSSSVLMAETWVRSNVLAYYPATNISKIIVGHSVLCNKDEQHKLGLVLPSIKNIHYSLTRWGLQNDIKVAASFSSDCLDANSEAYRVDVAQAYIKPLLSTLQEIGSPYVVNPPPHLHALSDEASITLLESHTKSMRTLGVFHPNKVNAIISSPRKEKPSSRKLAFIDISSIIDPYPPRPTPAAPSHSPSGSSVPAYTARGLLPPLVGTVSHPPNSLLFPPSLPPAVNPKPPPFLPHLAPMANPASPPFGPHLPPCNPSPSDGGGGSVSAPVAGVHNAVWCVAKPSVPPEALQEALDYACGEGGADCDAIRPDGSCYFPVSLVAHASYAFNSYWQSAKRNGGTCGFGGTAMLVNSDPSYRHCRFFLN